MNRRTLLLCGVIAPVLFVAMTILGGAIRPGYSHMTDTVSELFSPGSPNKALLDPLYILFSLLLILFGIGTLKYIQGFAQTRRIGTIGASMFIVMGLLSVTSATVFPQDAWGSPPTFAGQMHLFLHGVIGLLWMISILLIGIWLERVEGFRRFRIYSFATAGAVIVSAGFFVANAGSPIFGLTERISILVALQWTFVLALWMFSRKEKTRGRSAE